MALFQNTTGLVSLIVVAFAFAGEPALGHEDDNIDKSMMRLQTHMADMKTDMDAIENEPDAAKRQRMLRDHMEGMHEAIAIMQKEMMPSMRRVHRHKQRPSASHRDDTEAYDSDEHMRRMEAMMMQMQALLEQMAQHRRIMREMQ